MHTILLVVIVVLLLANVGVSVACLVKANKKNEKYEEPVMSSASDFQPLISFDQVEQPWRLSDSDFSGVSDGFARQINPDQINPDQIVGINKEMGGGMGGREESMMLSST